MHAHRSRIIAIAVLTTALDLMVGAVPAGAAETHTLDGSCSLVGIVRERPAQVVPAAGISFVYTASGHCYGTLDGVKLPVAGVPVSVQETGSELESCEVSAAAPFRTSLSFDLRGRRAFTLAFLTDTAVFAGPFGAFTGRGAGGGLLSGSAQIFGDSSDFASCVAGTYGTETTVALSFNTLMPISG